VPFGARRVGPRPKPWPFSRRCTPWARSRGGGAEALLPLGALPRGGFRRRSSRAFALVLLRVLPPDGLAWCGSRAFALVPLRALPPAGELRAWPGPKPALCSSRTPWGSLPFAPGPKPGLDGSLCHRGALRSLPPRPKPRRSSRTARCDRARSIDAASFTSARVHPWWRCFLVLSVRAEAWAVRPRSPRSGSRPKPRSSASGSRAGAEPFRRSGRSRAPLPRGASHLPATCVVGWCKTRSRMPTTTPLGFGPFRRFGPRQSLRRLTSPAPAALRVSHPLSGFCLPGSRGFVSRHFRP
jgi:hypothetical protein